MTRILTRPTTPLCQRNVYPLGLSIKAELYLGSRHGQGQPGPQEGCGVFYSYLHRALWKRYDRALWKRYTQVISSTTYTNYILEIHHIKALVILPRTPCTSDHRACQASAVAPGGHGGSPPTPRVKRHIKKTTKLSHRLISRPCRLIEVDYYAPIDRSH